MTVTPSRPSSTPSCRPHLLPAPSWEPPYDDELDPAVRSRSAAGPGHGPQPAVQGALALSFVLPSGVSAVPEAPALHLRVLPGTGGVPSRPTSGRGAAADPDLADFGPQPTARADLPEPRAWGGRLVQALVEVLAGDRPAGQLVRWTSGEVYDDVTALVPVRARPGRPRPPGRTGPPSRATVRSVHVTEPADGVAEVAATVTRGRRTTAVALRLEGLDGRWQCTALELG
jgi:hypothetical protein